MDEWIDWSQASELLGISVSKVRQLIREHQLAAAVPVPGEGQKLPAALIQDGLVVKGVSGVLTVLHDGGYDDREALVWLFTAGRDDPGLADRGVAREPRLGGQASRPGDGVLSPVVQPLVLTLLSGQSQD